MDIWTGQKFSFLYPGDYENSDEVMSIEGLVQCLVQGDTSVIRTAHDVQKQALLSLARQTWLYYILAPAAQEVWGRDCTSPNPSLLYLNGDNSIYSTEFLGRFCQVCSSVFGAQCKVGDE